ncbi:hypothetical protein D915_008208 [Fasciola hepatica]|uniref:Uncharacterized protein n=1 Tax=Fasciola hepatica TaxID=6192 RepID=A0A4E0R428_FASHE|nr:hypothetical protein D915_008208 [Fasciola hepatica]
MLYEEMRNAYNQHYRDRPVNARLVTEYAVESLYWMPASLVPQLPTPKAQCTTTRVADPRLPWLVATKNTKRSTQQTGEGLVGFYKGILPNLLRVVPACAITFVIYEYTVDLLRARIWI